MNNPPRKLKTPRSVFTKTDCARYLPGKAPKLDIRQAVRNCAKHKRKADAAAREIVEQNSHCKPNPKS